MLRTLCVIAVMTFAVSLPSRSSAPSTVRGRVEILRDLRPIARRPSVADLGTSTPGRAPDRRRSVVYLEQGPPAVFRNVQGSPLTMDQRRETFVPHVLAVTAGAVVDFPNSDETYHNVFSLSRVRSFDLGRYASGRSKSVRFDRPGIVRVFCDIHSHMSAFVLVFAHRFFAVTGEDGRYRIDDVPPGSYTVVEWHEVMERESREVTIRGNGGEVELNFALDRR